tara:strand:+ start:1934 stop:2452 length:519 start_codon:yes stop_codon:yes gene_type:complete
MKSFILRSFKESAISANFLILVTALITGIIIFMPIPSNTKEKNKGSSQHSLPIQETLTFPVLAPEVLSPMPVGEIEASSGKVKSTRNPFNEPSNLEITNLDVINSAIQFSGIAKSGKSLVAMIKTDEGQKAYKVGDSIGNGFVITSISSINVTVDISNGSKNYRLGLEALTK